MDAADDDDDHDVFRSTFDTAVLRGHVYNMFSTLVALLGGWL